MISELAELGARTLVRVGTCGALDDSLVLGELLIAGDAIAADGTSRALGAGERVRAARAPAPAQRRRPRRPTGAVASTDLFYDGEPGAEQRWLAAGALAVEMETATLFALAARRGLEAASVLIVSDILMPSRRRIEAERLREAEHRLGELAVRGLAR